jgi:predicted RNase H-like HicB family nuclease
MTTELEMRFMVRIFRQGDDSSAMIPELPGCVAAADSVEEVLELMGEAVALHLEMMARNGERIPTPRKVVNNLEEGEICASINVTTPRRTSRRRKTA